MNILKEVSKARAKGALLLEVVRQMQAIEELFPQGNGSTKLGMIRVWLENNLEMFGEVLGGIEVVWPLVEVYVKSMVDLFNKTGVFKKIAKAL